MMRTTLYSVIGKETTESDRKTETKQNTTVELIYIITDLKNKIIVDQLKTLSDVMFVVIAFAHFLFIYWPQK